MAEWFGVEFRHLPVTPDTKPAQEAAGAAGAARPRRRPRRAGPLHADPDARRSPTRWPNRIINIHHSFLPAFIGAKPYHQAHDRGVKIIGVTAHYATAVLDDGPIIAQDVVPREPPRRRRPTSSARAATSRWPCWPAPCGPTSSTGCWCTAARRSCSADDRQRVRPRLTATSRWRRPKL